MPRICKTRVKKFGFKNCKDGLRYLFYFVSCTSCTLPTLYENLSVAGKATGIVTNTRITHATPAALFGHSPSRYWEDDSKVPAGSRKSCKDLARQLIENDPGRNINVSNHRLTCSSLSGLSSQRAG